MAMEMFLEKAEAHKRHFTSSHIPGLKIYRGITLAILNQYTWSFHMSGVYCDKCIL